MLAVNYKLSEIESEGQEGCAGWGGRGKGLCDPFGDDRSALSALKEANHMAGSEGELKVDLALTEFSLIEDEASDTY